MEKIKLTECQIAQTISTKGMDFGLVDFDNYIAYIRDPDTYHGNRPWFHEALLEDIKSDEFKINYYRPEFTAMEKETHARIKAQNLEIFGLHLGILDIEDKVAYMHNPDTWAEKTLELDPNNDIIKVYFDFMQNLKNNGYKINFFVPESNRETKRAYDIFS